MQAILSMKHIILFIAFICITTSSKAQLYEIGVFAGGSNYIGDIGPEAYINPNKFMGGIIYKWNLNPRIAVRGTFTYAQIGSDDLDSSNNARYSRGIGFTNTIKELAVGIEYNYFDYNIDNFRQTQTPYLLFEVAAFNYKTITKETGSQQYEYKSKTSFAIPFGIGYKTKLFQDFAIAFEVRARYTFVDNIDYNNSKIDSLTFGNPNSNDWYMLSGITLSYTFGRPPCYAAPY